MEGKPWGGRTSRLKALARRMGWFASGMAVLAHAWLREVIGLPTRLLLRANPLRATRQPEPSAKSITRPAFAARRRVPVCRPVRCLPRSWRSWRS